jgi:hypothetical protein
MVADYQQIGLYDCVVKRICVEAHIEWCVINLAGLTF